VRCADRTAPYVERFLAAIQKNLRAVSLRSATPHSDGNLVGSCILMMKEVHAIEGNPQASMIADSKRSDEQTLLTSA